MKQKRKRKSSLSEDETEQISNVKCSLSSIYNSKDYQILSDAILYCSKLRVLVTLVAKHHIFKTLSTSTDPLQFEPGQTYLSRVKSMVINGKLSKPEPLYKNDLEESKNHVCGDVPVPEYSGKLSKGTLTILMQSMLRQLAVGLKTHVYSHAFHCLNNWLNNQIRAHLLTDEEYNDHRYQRKHIGTYKKTLDTCKPELKNRFRALKKELDGIFNLGPKEPKVGLLVCNINLKYD